MTTEKDLMDQAQRDLREIDRKRENGLRAEGSAMLGAHLIAMLSERPRITIDEKVIADAHEQIRALLRVQNEQAKTPTANVPSVSS